MSETATVNQRPGERRFGRYRVLRPIGEGGMGSVYLAHDDLLRRDVAVKTVAPVPGAVAEEFNTRFLNEARCVAALAHPNIVPVYDMGIEGDAPFLVMEVVNGPSLRERLHDGEPMPPRSARTLGIQIANALAAAHRAGIVHRDVKPANLLEAEPDHWKLVDFGVAHVPDSSITVAGQFLGTPTYAAPETLTGGEFSPASDVYGLAATLYEILTGEPPHGRGNAVKIALASTAGPPVPIIERAPEVPLELASVVDSALARDPAQRPSAEAFAHALAAAEATAERSPAPPQRNRRGMVGKLLIGSAVLAVALFYVVGSAGDDPPAPAERASSAVAPAAGAEPEADDPTQDLAAGEAPALAAADEEVEPPAADEPDELDEPVEPETAAAAADTAAAPPEPAATAAPSGAVAPGQPEPGLDGLAEVERLIRRGAKTAAVRQLTRLRKAHPDSAYLPYLQGQLYFERMWWKDGFEAYTAAIRRNPAYRSHAPLIRDAIRNLSSLSQSWRGTRFLVREIGAPAIPLVEAALAETRGAKLRHRMSAVLKKLQR